MSKLPQSPCRKYVHPTAPINYHTTAIGRRRILQLVRTYCLWRIICDLTWRELRGEFSRRLRLAACECTEICFFLLSWRLVWTLTTPRIDILYLHELQREISLLCACTHLFKLVTTQDQVTYNNISRTNGNLVQEPIGHRTPLAAHKAEVPPTCATISLFWASKSLGSNLDIEDW